MSDYKLELHTGPVIRTHWWKDLDDDKAPSNVWWLTGGGLSRPATDVEIDFWLRGEQKQETPQYCRICGRIIEALDVRVSSGRPGLWVHFECYYPKRCDKLGSCKRTEGHAGSCNTTRGE